MDLLRFLEGPGRGAGLQRGGCHLDRRVFGGFNVKNVVLFQITQLGYCKIMWNITTGILCDMNFRCLFCKSDSNLRSCSGVPENSWDTKDQAIQGFADTSSAQEWFDQGGVTVFFFSFLSFCLPLVTGDKLLVRCKALEFSGLKMYREVGNFESAAETGGTPVGPKSPFCLVILWTFNWPFLFNKRFKITAFFLPLSLSRIWTNPKLPISA